MPSISPDGRWIAFLAPEAGVMNDQEDAVRWAIAENIADPKRIAIYGASYGGSAALAGVAFTPEIYRCALHYVGVTDLGLLRGTGWMGGGTGGGGGGGDGRGRGRDGRFFGMGDGDDRGSDQAGGSVQPQQGVHLGNPLFALFRTISC